MCPQRFTYRLNTKDGEDAGTFETPVPNWEVGDSFVTGNRRHLRIAQIIPLERIQEFQFQPLYGLWQVEAVAKGRISRITKPLKVPHWRVRGEVG